MVEGLVELPARSNPRHAERPLCAGRIGREGDDDLAVGLDRHVSRVAIARDGDLPRAVAREVPVRPPVRIELGDDELLVTVDLDVAHRDVSAALCRNGDGLIVSTKVPDHLPAVAEMLVEVSRGGQGHTATGDHGESGDDQEDDWACDGHAPRRLSACIELHAPSIGHELARAKPP